MCLFRVPNETVHSIVLDPLEELLGGRLVMGTAVFSDNLIEIFDGLDSLLKELRLKALLDKLKFEVVCLFQSLLARHHSLFDH